MGLFDGFFKPDVEGLERKRDVNGLIKALGYLPDNRVRSDAASALGNLRDARAVEPLIAAIRDPDWGVRNSAIRALGELGDPMAIQPLIEILKEDPCWVTASALKNLGWCPHMDSISAHYWIGLSDFQQCVSIGAPAVDPLVVALNDNDWKRRKEAANALGQIKDPRAVDFLIPALLNDAEGVVRSEAAEALGTIGDPKAVTHLIVALQQENTHVATHKSTNTLVYASALSKLGSPAVEPLIAILGDLRYDPELRHESARALGDIADPGSIQPLITALKDASGYVREAAARALGKIRDPSAVEPLTAILMDSEDRASEMAADALGEIRDPRAVEPLLAALKDLKEIRRKDVTRSYIAGALEKIGDPRAIDPMIIALSDDPYRYVRLTAARILGNNRSVNTLESLISALKDPDSGVREVVMEEIGKFDDPLPIEPLLAAITDTDFHVRRRAAELLIKLDACDKLGDDDKNRILTIKPLVRTPHKDVSAPSDCGHEDTGIGLTFP